MTQGPDSNVGNSHSALLPPGPSPRQGHVDNPFLPRDDAAPVPSRPRPELRRSLGVLKMLILVGGTLAIFAVVGFLAFIWKSANDAIVETSPSPSATVWKRLLDSGRLLQVITVSTVLIRFVAALQVGVVTQMLASFVLERGGCSLEDLALLSLTRAETSGPFGGVAFAIWRQRGLANRVFGVLLFLLLIVSGATQLSSTILVADFGPAKVFGNYNKSNINVALQHQGSPFWGTEKKSYWASRAPAYFRFAEDPGSAIQGEDYYDTGTTIRAFLPLGSSSQRTAMRSYAGVTSAFDARVACVRPRLTGISGSLTINHMVLKGNISWTDQHEGVQRFFHLDDINARRTADAVPFSCVIVDAVKPDFNYPQPPVTPMPIFMCPVGDEVGFIKSVMRPEWDYTNRGSDGYFLFNLTAPLNLWKQRTTTPDSTPGEWFLNQTGFAESNSSGIWQSLRFDGSNIGIDITLCFFHPDDRNYQITANSTRDGQEPSPRWWNTRTGEYGSEAARDFLGATLQRRTPEDRGLLRLHPQRNWSAARSKAEEAVQPRTFYNTWSSWVRPQFGTSISLNTAKPFGFDGINVPHRSHASLFQNIMANTGNNAALALQALFTTLMQMAYYDLLDDSYVELTSTMLFSQNVIIPNKWTGFLTFCGVFAAHFVIMLVITAAFLNTNRISFLGNAWHAVAQVVAEAPPNLDVVKFTDKTDDQVKNNLRRKPGYPPVFIRTSAVGEQQRKGKGEEAEQNGYKGLQSEDADTLRRAPLGSTS
ncbi:hypothetical protein RB598_000502 [Gaeumannomyces tritici]